MGPSLEPPKRLGPSAGLTFGPPTCRTQQKQIFVMASCWVCGNLIQDTKAQILEFLV